MTEHTAETARAALRELVAAKVNNDAAGAIAEEKGQRVDRFEKAVKSGNPGEFADMTADDIRAMAAGYREAMADYERCNARLLAAIDAVIPLCRGRSIGELADEVGVTDELAIDTIELCLP